MDVRGRVNWLCSRQVIPFDLEPVSPDWTAFLHVASHWPGLGPAADRLLCCTTKKSARKRTPLSRPLRGCPLSGSVRRGLRKLALRAQTCAALFPPAEPSSRRARGERKCRLPTVSVNSSARRGSVHRKNPFRAGRLLGAAQGSHSRSEKPGWPGRLLCWLSWRRKKASRPPGAEAGFRGACSAPP